MGKKTMTPEQFEQAKREFAEKWGIRYQPEEPGYYELKNDSDNCLSDLTALLEQHKEMIMSFTEWTGNIYYDNSRWLVKGEEEMTTQELYEFWLKNVKR